jgi:diacylglycerol kinase (ATP)
VTRPVKPVMRARSPNLRRDRGALHPVDGDAAHIEPFDDVREDGVPLNARSANGANDAYNDAADVAGTPAALSRGAMDSVEARDHATASASPSRARSNERTTVSTSDTSGAPSAGADVHAGVHANNHADAHEPLGPDDPLTPLPFNPYKGNRGLTRAWHAMKNSLAGFQVAIREESAFRQELTLAAILLPCGIFVPVEPVARVLLLGSVLLVLIVELLNSSVEAAIDRISLERHELSRRAKDLGSAAVMVALGMCVMTWALIVGPLLIRWIGLLF